MKTEREKTMERVQNPETMTADPRAYMASVGANSALVIFVEILLENLSSRSCLKAQVVAEGVLNSITKWSGDLIDLPFGSSFSGGGQEQMAKLVKLCKKVRAEKTGMFDHWTTPTVEDIKIPDDWMETEPEKVDFSNLLVTEKR